MYARRRRRSWVIAYALGCLFCGASVAAVSFAAQRSIPERGPPSAVSSSPLLLPPLFSDQSAYVALGDDAGSAIAVGDFTRDRFSDLVMADKPKFMRSLRISAWREREWVFRPVSQSWNSSQYSSTFSLDSMSEIPATSHIVAAAPFDANADGMLDLLVSVELAINSFVGIILLGNGMGGLYPATTLEGVGPDLLIVDGDNDLVADIMFTSSDGYLAFYKNAPPGTFTLQPWNPYDKEIAFPTQLQQEQNSTFRDTSKESDPGDVFSACKAVTGVGSHAFVDMNGDCLPDLVVATQTCGLHVWLNSPSPVVRIRDRDPISVHGGEAFWDMSLGKDTDSFVALSKDVWDAETGDGRAVFADFNGDGTIDVAVPNSELSVIRLSLNEQADRKFGRLCTQDLNWKLRPYTALHDIRLADTTLGPSLSSAALHTGDFNYDGLLDLLIINADTGVVQLLAATRADEEAYGFWNELRSTAVSPGGIWRRVKAQHHKVTFEDVSEGHVLSSIEDPVAAAFFDVDESGRQDILIVQAHGTRLVWNSYNEVDDSEFFKATASNAVYNSSKKLRVSTRQQPFVPMAGNTMKISYGGRNGHEQHVCTQCPQAGFLTLQPCTCLFGIRRIANYIEELSMGGGGAVRTWSALMPNAMAILWPVDRATGHWRVAYFTRSRGRQMFGVVLVLSFTLIVLACAIAYIHALERVDERQTQLKLQHHFRV